MATFISGEAVKFSHVWSKTSSLPEIPIVLLVYQIMIVFAIQHHGQRPRPNLHLMSVPRIRHSV